jgi:glutathione synthase/RimK-type ligase-like ATP-grasp enzyme
MDYTYQRSHYPNNVSWYRELVLLDGVLVGEIREPVHSTPRNKVYRVCKYEPLQVANETIEIAQTVQEFSSVSDAKDFINNGGIK